MTTLVLIVIISYSILQTIEMLSFGSRIAGKVSNRLALGTTLHHTLYTGSRFLLIFLLPGLGFLVESGIEESKYVALVSISLFISFVSSLFILFNLNRVQKYFQMVFYIYHKENIIVSIIKPVFTKNSYACKNLDKKSLLKQFSIKNVLISFIAYLFLVTGFFVAFFLAVTFPEYRLTLSQATAAFHGIGAILIAFYLDPMLSDHMDMDDGKWLNDSYSIILGRIISYLTSFIAFLLYFLYINLLH